MITINTSAPTAGATLTGTSATSLVARLRTRSRAALAGVGCFVAVAAASAVLSAPAMAATHCELTTTTYPSQPISATLSGELCFNGTTSWDPNPAATKLTYDIPWYMSRTVSVSSTSKGNYNYESGNRGTEEIWGNVDVLASGPINGLGSVFGIYLRLDCTPTGRCTTRAFADPLG